MSITLLLLSASCPLWADLGPAVGLGTGNTIRIRSTTEKSLSGTFELDWEGYVEVPPCQKFLARGLSLSELQDTLQMCLSKYIKQPFELRVKLNDPLLFAIRIGWRNEKQVTLKVSSFTSVQSALAKGRLSIEPKTTIRLISPYGLDVVLPASDSMWNDHYPWRGGESLILEKPIETLVNYTVDILGEVRRPGTFKYRPSLSVLAAIREAQGLTSSADPDSVVVIRNSSGGKIGTVWDDSSTKIEPGDVIHVNGRQEGLFDRSLRWTGSILAVVNTIVLLIIAGKSN